MSLLSDVKSSLRLSSTAIDIDIQNLIDASKLDLQLSGVLEAKILDTDALIKRAVTLYVKAYCGEIDSKALNAYNSLKMHLCLSVEYTEV